MIALSILLGCALLGWSHFLAARVRAQGARDAARLSAPVFQANAGGTLTVTVLDPNAKIGGGP
jgi:hypothetical protein